MENEKLSMKDLPYHYGIVVRCYPNSKQKQIIKQNSDASRYIYNQCVGKNLAKQDCLTSHHEDYYKLINYLVKRDKVDYRFAKFRVDQRWISAKTIKQAKAKHAYQRIISDYPVFAQRYQQLEQRTKTAKTLSTNHLFLFDKNIDSLALANAKQNYQQAWNMFRKVHHTGTPKFHKKNYRESYQTNAHYGNVVPNLFNGTGIRLIDYKHIMLPKLGKIRISRLRDNVLNMQYVRIGTATVKKDSADNYTISLQLGSTQPFVKALPKTNQSIGVDLNTENYLTDSQGNVVANPRFYRRIKHQLAKQQRTLSRRARRAKKEHRSLRDSKNYQKQRLIVANLHEKIYRQRKDFLNNLTTAIIKNHDVIVAEELRSKNLLKNHALALSISDVGWRTFLAQLEYKAELYDKQFVTVSPKNTTQTCHCCGYVCGSDNRSKKLTLAERKWTCPNCNTIHIRDKNAAINILNKGLAKLASA